MEMTAKILAGLVALEHAYFLWLEMFRWTTPRVMKTFGTDKDFAERSKSLAANQGLYNGFLAAGLIWGLLHPDAGFGFQVRMFFLGCVLVAAIFGAATAKRSILWIQGMPALLALAAGLCARFL